jgi:hypothetical protein
MCVCGAYVSLKVRGRGLRATSSKRLHRRLRNSVLKILSRKLSAVSSWRMKKSSCRVLGKGGRKTGEASGRTDLWDLTGQGQVGAGEKKRKKDQEKVIIEGQVKSSKKVRHSDRSC